MFYILIMCFMYAQSTVGQSLISIEFSHNLSKKEEVILSRLDYRYLIVSHEFLMHVANLSLE